ncbi:zinc-finger protein [Orobanche hederae]
MESKLVARWGFKNGKESGVTNRDLINRVRGNLNKYDEREIINLGNGDPTPYPSFKTTPVAEEALLEALRSTAFNGYPPPKGLSATRRAVADHSSVDLRHKLSEDDVFITSGASQAIELITHNPDSPRHYFDLLPDRGWEVDLDGVEALIRLEVSSR